MIRTEALHPLSSVVVGHFPIRLEVEEYFHDGRLVGIDHVHLPCLYGHASIVLKAKHRLGRWVYEVLDRPLKRLGVVPEVAEDVPVAGLAEESPNTEAAGDRAGTTRVVVVHGQPPPAGPPGTSADVAGAALCREDRLVLLLGDAVRPLDVSSPSPSLTLGQHRPMVCVASRARVLRLPLCRHAFSHTVFARRASAR